MSAKYVITVDGVESAGEKPPLQEEAHGQHQIPVPDPLDPTTSPTSMKKKNWYFLIKPYYPSSQIDWEAVTLAYGSNSTEGEGDAASKKRNPFTQRFQDPLVDEEYRVYSHRDSSQILLGLLFSTLCPLLVGSDIIKLPRGLQIAYCIGNVFTLLITCLDAFCFWKLDATAGGSSQRLFPSKQLSSLNNCREGASKIRSFCMYVMLTVFSIYVGIGTIYSFGKNCTDATDLFDLVGLRESPLHKSAEQGGYDQDTIDAYCTRIVNPFMIFFTTTGVIFAGLAAPTVAIFLLLLLNLSLQLVSFFAYTDRGHHHWQDLVGRFLFVLVCWVFSLTFHFFSHRSTQAVFLQEIHLFISRLRATRKQEEVDALLSNILPTTTLQRLSAASVRDKEAQEFNRNSVGVALSSLQEISDYTEEASVLFSDIQGFTAWSSTRTAREVVAMLQTLCWRFDQLAVDSGVEKIKTIGDAYWAVSGLPDPCLDHAWRLCTFGNKMLDIVEEENNFGWTKPRISDNSSHRRRSSRHSAQRDVSSSRSRGRSDATPPAKHLAESHQLSSRIAIRIGVHTGPLSGGILGTQQLSYEVYGSTSQTANLVESKGVPGRVVVSGATLEALEKSGLDTKGCQWITSLDTENRHNQPQSSAGPTPGLEKMTAALSVSLPKIITTESHSGTIDLYQFPRLGVFHKRRESEASSTIPQRSISAASNSSRTPASDAVSKLPERQRVSVLFQPGFIRGKRKLPNSGNSSDHDSEQGVAIELKSSLEAIEERYSKRKYSMIFSEYADEAAERSFLVSLANDQRPTRLLSRVTFVCVVITILIACILRRSFYEMPTISIVMLSLAAGLEIVDALLIIFVEKGSCGRGGSLQHFQAIVQHLAGILLLAGAGPMPAGINVITNDIACLTQILSALLISGNIGFTSFVFLAAANALIINPISTWQSWDIILLTCHSIFGYCTLIFAGLSFILLEKRHRNQFFQRYVADYYNEQQEEKTEEQESLLRAMVPQHIVQPLMHWRNSGMDAQDSIVQELKLAAVCFVRLELPQDIHNSLPHAFMPCFSDCEAQDMHPFTVNTLQKEDKDGSFPKSQMLRGRSALKVVHHLIDKILLGEQVSSMRSSGKVEEERGGYDSVVKIKTIGDTLMLAGPFSIHAEKSLEVQVAETCRQMIRLCRELKAQLTSSSTESCQDSSFRAGIHCGELVGAVLGHSKLCFDVFGDTVNTASRVMESASQVGEGASQEAQSSITKVAVSSEVRLLLSQCGSQSVLSEVEIQTNPLLIQAKGKGSLEVYPVTV